MQPVVMGSRREPENAALPCMEVFRVLPRCYQKVKLVLWNQVVWWMVFSLSGLTGVSVHRSVEEVKNSEQELALLLKMAVKIVMVVFYHRMYPVTPTHALLMAN